MSYTDEQVTEAITKAVDKKGYSYVYPRNNPVATGPQCVYVNTDGSPSCIVGHVIATLAPEKLPEIKEWERRKNQHDGTAVPQLLMAVDLGFTPKQANALRQAQEVQDYRETWGQALMEYTEAMSVG